MIYSTSQLVDKSAGDVEGKQRTLCPHKNTLSTVCEENLPSGAAQVKTPSPGVCCSQGRNHLFSGICTRKAVCGGGRATSQAAPSSRASVCATDHGRLPPLTLQTGGFLQMFSHTQRRRHRFTAATAAEGLEGS